MDKALAEALKGEHEERDFYGTAVRIRHLSAAERLDMVDKYSEDVDSKKSVEFFVELVTSAVDGVTAKDARNLRDASWPRLEALANLVLEVNGMREKDAGELAGN